MSLCSSGKRISGKLTSLRRDYATWTNEQEGIYSNAMSCDYKMVRINECIRLFVFI